MKINKTVLIVLVVILLFALFLRLYRLDHQSLWSDEIGSVNQSRPGVAEIFYVNLNPGNTTYLAATPPLQYSIMHFFLLAKDSDFMARLPSVIFGVLSILMIFIIGREFYGSRTGLFSALLMAISVYHIMYSQEARPYSMMIFFSLASFYCLWKAMKTEKQGHWYWAGLVLFTVLNLYNHFFAVFAVLANVLVFCYLLYKLGSDRKRKAGLFVFCMLIAFLIYLPLFKNIAYLDMSPVTNAMPVEFNLGYYENLLSRYGAGTGIAFLIYNLAFVAGLLSFRKKLDENVSLLMLLAVPFFVLSFVKLNHFFHIRYVMFTFPVYLLFVSRGVDNAVEFAGSRLKPSWSENKKLAIGFLAVLIVFGGLAVVPLQYYYNLPSRLADWKGAARFVDENFGRNTTVIVESGYAGEIFQYYLDKGDKKFIHTSSSGNVTLFRKLIAESSDAVYVAANPVYDSIAGKYFADKKAFGSEYFEKLGKMELIDWDNSWFPMEKEKERYFLVVYYDKKNISVEINDSSKWDKFANYVNKSGMNLLENGDFEEIENGIPKVWASQSDNIISNISKYRNHSYLLRPKKLAQYTVQEIKINESLYRATLGFGVWARAEVNDSRVKLQIFGDGISHDAAKEYKVFNVSTDWNFYHISVDIDWEYRELGVYVYPDDFLNYSNIYIDGAIAVDENIGDIANDMEYVGLV